MVESRQQFPNREGEGLKQSQNLGTALKLKKSQNLGTVLKLYLVINYDGFP